MDHEPKKYRLKDNHPAIKAFNELCGKANDLGIRIEFYGSRTIVSYDEEEFDLEDLENPDESMSSFPPMFECKLTFEK